MLTSPIHTAHQLPLSESGASGFKIKNERGKVVSVKKQEVEEISEWYALQIGNSLTVLSQDNAKQFLNAASPAQTYKYLVSGVQDTPPYSHHFKQIERPRWLGYSDFFRHIVVIKSRGLNIQFDTPFVSYDTDFLTMVDEWPSNRLENGIDAGDNVVDRVSYTELKENEVCSRESN
ncbi:hypothetical protein ACHAO4_006589 [Trichoderma viride]